MRVVCGPDPVPLEPSEGTAFSLFRRPLCNGVGRAAAGLSSDVLRAGVEPSKKSLGFPGHCAQHLGGGSQLPQEL